MLHVAKKLVVLACLPSPLRCIINRLLKRNSHQLSLFFVFVDDDQEGVLDGLMEALNTGSAFRDPSRPLRKKAPGGKKGEQIISFNLIHTSYKEP